MIAISIIVIILLVQILVAAFLFKRTFKSSKTIALIVIYLGLIALLIRQQYTMEVASYNYIIIVILATIILQLITSF